MQNQESSNESKDLSSVDTSEIITKLDEYNQRFNWGASLARETLAHLQGEKKNESGFVGQVDQEKIFFEHFKAEVQPALSLTGLDMLPVNNGSFAITENITHKFTELRLNLEDGEKFVEYLKSLNVENITDSQKEGLNKVAKVIIKQIEIYDLDKPNDAFFELIKNLSDIISEYKRLNLENIKELEDYNKHALKGSLKEFMAVKNLKLNREFVPDSGFVLEWHRDATPETLEKYWNKVFDILTMIANNEKASDLYTQARYVAGQAADSAINDISQMQLDERHKKYAEPLMPVLLSVKSRLEEF